MNIVKLVCIFEPHPCETQFDKYLQSIIIDGYTHLLFLTNIMWPICVKQEKRMKPIREIGPRSR